MTSIVGWSSLLMHSSLSPTQTRHAIETIARNALSQTRLVDELLDLSRTMTGKLRLNIESLMPAPIVQRAVDAVRVAAEAKNIRIELMLDSQAGPISCDSHRLEQVVWNLLTNAVKFTPKNGRIQVILERKDSYVLLRVSDTGIGVAPEFLPLVFDRFLQADASTTREHGGLGIGLALVRQIVELHGGTVTAASLGRYQGTTFTVRLPVRIVHEEAAEELAPAESAVSFIQQEPRTTELKDLRVLAVDDDASALELIRFILQSQGANVFTATSAREAISSVDTFEPEVLISDIGMPGEDGYALIQKLREREVFGHRIPALALTA
jgi:CheY-like chemotaxis protein